MKLRKNATYHKVNVRYLKSTSISFCWSIVDEETSNVYSPSSPGISSGGISSGGELIPVAVSMSSYTSVVAGESVVDNPAEGDCQSL